MSYSSTTQKTVLLHPSNENVGQLFSNSMRYQCHMINRYHMHYELFEFVIAGASVWHVGILATALAEGCYYPLSVYSDSRLHQLLDDTAARVVLTLVSHRDLVSRIRGDVCLSGPD